MEQFTAWLEAQSTDCIYKIQSVASPLIFRIICFINIKMIITHGQHTIFDRNIPPKNQQIQSQQINSFGINHTKNCQKSGLLKGEMILYSLILLSINRLKNIFLRGA
jgi:hypothetical protein